MSRYSSPRAEFHFDQPPAPRPEIGRRDLDARHEDMRQIAAISAFEGLRPTPDYEKLRSSYVSGEFSASEFKTKVLARWKRNV